MTAPARITQADMERAVKAAAKTDRARVIFDLANRRIEVIIGDPSPDSPQEGNANPWDDE